MHRLLIGPQLPDHTEDVGEEPDHGKHQRISEVKIEVDDVSSSAIGDCFLAKFQDPAVHIIVVGTLQQGMEAVLTDTSGAEGASWTVLLFKAVESYTCWKDVVEKFKQKTGLL